MTSAGELPIGAQALRDGCVRFLDAAAGGGVLVSAVEETPAAVQEAWIDIHVMAGAAPPEVTIT